MRGDAAAAGGYSASALQGTDAHLLSRAYYTADFDVATQHEGVSWAPKVALMVTALAAMFLIGIIGLFIMSKDISANILAHNDYRVSEYDGFDPASSRSPLPDVRVLEKTIAGRRETASTRRGTVTASKAPLGSSTPRSDQHHHGPRYADDGVSQTTDKAAEAQAATTLGFAERTEEAATKADTELTDTKARLLRRFAQVLRESARRVLLPAGGERVRHDTHRQHRRLQPQPQQVRLARQLPEELRRERSAG